MVRFESSVTEIRAVFEVVQPRHEVVATLVLAPIVADSARLVSRIAVSSLSKRGPPSLMRFSSN